MKQGKEDEKAMGPMFPRLHVNDTEKGGPRAPPRNKMALYEQLCIPTQRFKPGAVPSNPNSANPASSSQGSGSVHQRNAVYSHSLPPSFQCAEKPGGGYDSSASFMALQQQKHPEEDDFRVPIFMQTHISQDRGTPFLFTPSNAELLMKQITNTNSELRRSLADGPNSRQQGRNQNDENVRDFIEGGEQSLEPLSNSMFPTSGTRSPEDIANSCLDSSLLGYAVRNEPTRFKSKMNSSPVQGFHSEDDERILDDSESCEDRYKSLPNEVPDGDDDASETSIVDSICGVDVTPDDVVGIIGQKQFWKARRSIVNQQRVFAVQVFELHRLIKVQKLMAGSPPIMVKDSAFVVKPIKGSSPKLLPVEYAVKEILNGSKRKNDSEKQNNKLECSAENTVGKTSVSSVQNVSQLPSYTTFATNSLATTGAGDHSTNPWCYPQPQGHQWLIPVMSPSEGLVYKPYPGPGFMAPGCGPPGLTPMMGNFYPPAHGASPNHHFPGMGVPPFTAPGPHGNFPPYGMHVMNQGIASSQVMNQGIASSQVMNQGITSASLESMAYLDASGLHEQLPIESNVQREKPSSLSSNQKSGSTAVVIKSRVSRDGDVHTSSVSSQSRRVQAQEKSFTAEGSNVLPLFPTSPIVRNSSLNSQPSPPPASQEVDHSTRVIKVVPRNGRSATESVARIFLSIQEERRHCDSS